MRRSSGILLLAFIVYVVRVPICGPFLDFDLSGHEQFNENFVLCIGILVVIAGLAILGVHQFEKERKSLRQKNKMIVNEINDIYDNQGKKIPSFVDSTSNKKRLPPTNGVLRELLRRSGNKCNFHLCPHVIFDYQGFVKGHVISIMSNEKEQPNYNPNLSNEDRIKIGNLMLLCDEDFLDTKLFEKNTISTLRDQKREAEESPNRDQTFEIDDKIIEKLKQDYLNREL